MKLNEIWHSQPQRDFTDTYDVDQMALDYESIEDDPPIDHNPQAWMPDMRTRPTYAVTFYYDYTPAERGSRERGSGIPLEPDYGAGVDIIGAEIFDPRTKKDVKVDPELYFSNSQLEQVNRKIMDSLEYSPPDRDDYDDNY